MFPSSLRSFFWIVPSTTHLKTKHFQISIPPLFLSNITASGKYLNRFIFSLRLARTNMRASDGTQSKLDCKTVGFFFTKSVKKSVKRGVRVLRARSARASHASLFSASFQTFCSTARAYLNTLKYGLFCSLNLNPQSLKVVDIFLQTSPFVQCHRKISKKETICTSKPDFIFSIKDSMFESYCELLGRILLFIETLFTPTGRTLVEFLVLAKETWCRGEDGGLSSVSLGLLRSDISSSRAALLDAIRSPNLKTIQSHEGKSQRTIMNDPKSP